MKNIICKIFVLSLALLTLLSLLSLTVAAEGETTVESQSTVETNAETADLTETATVTDAETEEAIKEATEAVTDGETEAALNFNFQPNQFVNNLKYMAAGMVGIFLVIGVIILTILILGKLTAPRNKDEK